MTDISENPDHPHARPDSRFFEDLEYRVAVVDAVLQFNIVTKAGEFDKFDPRVVGLDVARANMKELSFTRYDMFSAMAFVANLIHDKDENWVKALFSIRTKDDVAMLKELLNGKVQNA